MAKETIEAAVIASYKRGVEETEKSLAKEVAKVCRDYCTESYMKALNRAGVPADSELRKAESVFFPKHIREAPTDLPLTTTLSLPPFRQASDTQDLTVGGEIPPRVVGKGKEVPPLAKDIPIEDSLTIKDMVSQAKVVDSTSNVGDAKHKATHLEKGSQPAEK